MLFNSFPFLFLFLPIAYLVFWALRSAQQRYMWLTITGYAFYSYWDPRFCLLMAFSTIVSYFAGLGFLKYSDPKVRRLFLVVPITVDLCLLGFFKYADFGLRNVQWLLDSVGIDRRLPVFDIVLPVGISFYTFHTITYIVDSYRRVIQPTRNLFEFSAYVSLFSQLVAGPIVRFRQIEKDLEELGSASRDRWLGLGASFFIYGLVEKVIVADSLARYVDPGLASHAAQSSLSTWLLMLGYSFQLYFDFCGYSDMAVGLGYMFGLRIPQNFNSPYKSRDPSEFWKRWHISLSTCMRDYLYIPLGGNRNGEWGTYRNLLLTMLIGGLWHGANWTFVIWGGYHGALLIFYRRYAQAWDQLPPALARSLMLVLVVVGWVFFRSTDFHMAADVLTKMFVPTGGEWVDGAGPLGAMVAIAAIWAIGGPNAFDLHRDYRWKWWRGNALASILGCCLAVMAGGGSSPFLYFQF